MNEDEFLAKADQVDAMFATRAEACQSSLTPSGTAPLTLTPSMQRLAALAKRIELSELAPQPMLSDGDDEGSERGDEALPPLSGENGPTLTPAEQELKDLINELEGGTLDSEPLQSDDDEDDVEIDEEEDETTDTYEGKYGFKIEDIYFLQQLSKEVRKLVARPDLEPQQIAQLGAFLYALERLPMVTEGVNMSVGLAYRVGRESNYQEIRVDADSFRLMSGGYVYEEGVGGDSFSDVIFEAFAEGGREGDELAAFGFLEGFKERVRDESCCLEIDDNSDEPLNDWEQEMPDDPWEGISDDD